jgi:hypothetical protein
MSQYTNTEKVSEDDQKHLWEWNPDKRWKAMLIMSGLSQLVADLVLTYSDAKDI